MLGLEISKKQVLSYSLLPQAYPRIKELIFSGFASLAYFIALVYRATNILPKNHLYLKPENIGKYTVQNVITEASKNVVFDLKHIDQVIVFFALIAGIFLLAFQFLFLLVAIMINPSFAAEAGNLNLPGINGFGDFFTTKNPDNDIAFRILDAVFGVPQIFGSRETINTEFHQALHGLFQLYSFGLLVVAAIILIYFIFAIVAETAQTGTPFGKRYNHVWAPIRLVVGIGLLVPMTFGLNAGQWITLYAAKFGSGFATTGWTVFNQTINDNFINPEQLVALPKTPSTRDLSAAMMIAVACKHAYTIKRPLVGEEIEAYVIQGATAEGNLATITEIPYAEAYKRSEGGNIRIRFGMESNEFTSQIQNVFPYCGEIILQSTEPTIDTVQTHNENPETDDGEAAEQNTNVAINEAYYNIIRDMWTADGVDIYAEMHVVAADMINSRIDEGQAADPGADLKRRITDTTEATLSTAILQARDRAVQAFTPEVRYETLGWGGASLWFNQVADMNGKITTAAMNTPLIKAYPEVMVYTCKKNEQQNPNTSPIECYEQKTSKGTKILYLSKLDESISKGLGSVFQYWYKDPSDKTGNIFIDVINAVLGLNGLFDLCDPENVDIHPLAQISSLGKGMVEAAIRNLGIAVGGGAAGLLAGYFGPTIDAASSFFGTIAGIGILLGFILYYIVPFLPFLYFLFAIGGWVKGLFEAMVGVPLWALAHLRIDGEGLPGEAALNGYFLIFEVFIRPILIIFGLIASMLVFAALVKGLNQTFTLAVSNLSGFDASKAQAGQGCGPRSVQEPGTIEWMRGPVDEFFFTVVYAIIVYMIGMSCFKLIDLIPNNILRWMGQGVQTFNDQAGDSAEGLVSKLTIGGSLLSGQLEGAVSGAKQASRGIAAGAAELAKK